MIVRHSPRGLHALHLDPILPVAPETHPKFNANQTWLQMPKAALPLSPKLHHLDDDMPGAYPSPLMLAVNTHEMGADEAVKTASVRPGDQAHRLSADSAARPGSPQPGLQNHRLSDDVQMPTAPPPVAVRWPSASWSTEGPANRRKPQPTAHATGEDADELAPVGEHGIEMHRLGADMLASTRM